MPDGFPCGAGGAGAQMGPITQGSCTSVHSQRLGTWLPGCRSRLTFVGEHRAVLQSTAVTLDTAGTSPVTTSASTGDSCLALF